MDIKKVSDQKLDTMIFEARVSLQCAFEKDREEEIRASLQTFLLERKLRKIEANRGEKDVTQSR